MLDVIIYEDNEVSVEKNIGIINQGLINNPYQIRVFNKWNDELNTLINTSNKKLYIINLETENGCGLKLARAIRKRQINDIIILTAKCTKYYDLAFNNRLLAFDYICKNNGYDKRLLKAINEASKLLFSDEMFIFKYNRMIYRISFSDINYIEKETNIKRCIIHTKDGEYYIVSSIDKLLDSLNENFIKAHQACIINLNNIRMLDCVNNRVLFDDSEYTSLLTERAKREIKNWLFNNVG